MTKTKLVKGYCEYLSDECSIKVTYIRSAALGSSQTYAIADTFSCTYEKDCGYGTDCPIYQAEDGKANIW